MASKSPPLLLYSRLEVNIAWNLEVPGAVSNEALVMICKNPSFSSPSHAKFCGRLNKSLPSPVNLLADIAPEAVILPTILASFAISVALELISPPKTFTPVPDELICPDAVI